MMSRAITFFVLILLSDKLVAQQLDHYELFEIVSVSTQEMKKNGASKEHLTNRGYAYLQMDSIRLAYLDFSKAIELASHDSYLFFLRSQASFKANNYRDALSDINQAITMSSDSLTFYVTRAILFERIGEKGRALQDYNFVLQKNPMHEFALRNRAILRSIEVETSKDAEEDWARLVESFDNEEYYFEAGTALSKIAPKKAILYLTKAIAINPDDQRYYVARGYAFGLSKELTLARSDFRMATDKGAQHGYVRKKLGEVLISNGEFSEGCENLLAARALGVSVENALLENCKP